MKQQMTHEPQAKVMSSEEVWTDAQRVADVRRHNLLKAEPIVRLQIPLSVFLAAIDDFDRDELGLVRQRIEEKLAA